MKSKIALLLVSMIGLPISCVASTFFFPDNQPAYTSIAAPKWLHEGHGDDGYVTVTSEVIPATNCVPLSNHSFWGGEKTQLVLSVTTTGFRNKLDGSETPIATFDGRDNGSQCATLSTLPINIVPLALLGTFSSFNPGELSLVLNVKSSSDSNQDFIGSAKFLLGAAAMVATGGSAIAIGGIASTVENPVLTEAQTRTQSLITGMVNSKTKVTLTWPKLRDGIQTIEIPVYRAESSLGSDADREIMQLQKDGKKTKLFTVRLLFNYISSLFDTAASDANGIPGPDSISTSSVLNYQLSGGPYNFLQILNDSSPSLSQAISTADGHNLTDACSIGFGKLRKAGLSNIDMAIVMKSFIDESRGGASWYGNSALVKSCFAQAPRVQMFLEKLYGIATPKFVIGDIQDGVGLSYQNWRDTIGPVLANFRSALTARKDRINALASFNGRHDINVDFSSDMEGWQDAAPVDGPAAPNPAQAAQSQAQAAQSPAQAAQSPYPGIEKLANRQIRTIGCFIYKEPENLNVRNPGAYFIMEDANEFFWLNAVKFATEREGKILSVNISQLSADWGKYFESYNYSGGECAGILSRYKRKALASISNP